VEKLWRKDVKIEEGEEKSIIKGKDCPEKGRGKCGKSNSSGKTQSPCQIRCMYSLKKI
jgi:hypothetical protein